MHYNGPVVRPYTDANSIILEVTVGCTHNSCTFCNFYKGCSFQIASLQQIEEDLKEVSQYQQNAREVWASGGNPYALSTEKLAMIAKLIRKYLPKARISTYARVDDLLRKSVEDMKYLRKLGIEDLVIGIESGYDPALNHVNKGYSASDILEGCKRLEKAGVAYRVIYLGGIAGSGKGEEAAMATAKLLNQLHPYYMFMTTVSVMPDTKLYNEVQAGKFKEASELERIREFRTLLSSMTNEIVVDSRSVANMIPFVGKMPCDKNKIIQKLDDMIDRFSQGDEELLRARRSRIYSV